ncbi:hypothetical protein BH23ACT9_BH23ACT9_27980 [soil metagenome]
MVLLLGALLVSATLSPAGAQDGELANPMVFAETSFAGNCADCHGSAGNGARIPGTDQEGPPVNDPDTVSAAYIDLVLRTGRMPPAGDPFDNRARHVFYTDAEREAMVAWMVQQFDLEDDLDQIARVEEGNVARGLELFALNCAHCHGNTGAGGTAGQNAWTPQIEQLDPITVAEAIRIGPFEMPAFGEETLSTQDVDDITSYLRAVDEEGGTPVFGLVELNPVFASGFVGLFALILLGSLLYIGGRPIPLEQVDRDDRDAIGAEDLAPPVPAAADPTTAPATTDPTATTAVEGDPGIERP